MLAFIKLVTRILAFPVVFSAAAFAPSADITGWHDLLWGSKKPAVSKALQSLRVHECRPSAETACATDSDELMIEDYRVNGVAYEVHLFFFPRYGLGRVTMSSDDERDSFRRALSELTGRYGKPGLQSEYDGEREVTRTKWNWAKPHGNLSLSSEYGEGTNGFFTITYAARFDENRP